MKSRMGVLAQMMWFALLSGCGGGGGGGDVSGAGEPSPAVTNPSGEPIAPPPQVPQELIQRPDAIEADSVDVDLAASELQPPVGGAPQASVLNPVQRENTRTVREGVTHAWGISDEARAQEGEIEGYASATSVNRGGRIKFFINVKDVKRDPWFGVDIYRMGWYGGKGGRKVSPTIYRYSKAQPACPMVDKSTRTIECDWKVSIDLGVTRHRNSACATSGVYLAKLTTATGKSSYIHFVVRDDERKAAAMFQTSASTYVAYNTWGGYSLYSAPTGQDVAHKVSFNRPYDAHTKGAGDFFNWEHHALRFVEREGYDVVYSTSVDTHTNANRLKDFKAFLSVGHDEYWSRRIYDAVEGARNAGVNLAFLGGNNAYWAMRLEPSSKGEALRSMAAYKYWSDRDAMTNTPDATRMWRSATLNRPESALIGVQYDYDPVDGDIVMDNCPAWMCKGTGLVKGSRLKGLLGYEVDTLAPESPRGIISVATSPYKAGQTTRYSTVSFYTHAPSGASVFATGSMFWNWGLDALSPYPERASLPAQRLTRNVLDRFVGRVSAAN